MVVLGKDVFCDQSHWSRNVFHSSKQVSIMMAKQNVRRSSSRHLHSCCCLLLSLPMNWLATLVFLFSPVTLGLRECGQISAHRDFICSLNLLNSLYRTLEIHVIALGLFVPQGRNCGGVGTAAAAADWGVGKDSALAACGWSLVSRAGCISNICP